MKLTIPNPYPEPDISISWHYIWLNGLFKFHKACSLKVSINHENTNANVDILFLTKGEKAIAMITIYRYTHFFLKYKSFIMDQGEKKTKGRDTL